MFRGDIYALRMGRLARHEEQGRRYGIILQVTEMLPRSLVIVAPTSRNARPASYRPEITIGTQTRRVLVEQIGALDIDRLGKFAGRASHEEMWAIDDALRTVLSLR